MRYEYDPEADHITWLADDEPSPIEGMTMSEYRRAVASIERSKRMTFWELVEENQRHIEQFRDLKPKK